MVKAARLDANGVYLGMDDLASPAELTPLHLAQITECDLKPGEYRWIQETGNPGNPYGGAFWSIAWLDRIAQTAAKEEEVRIRRAERSRLRAMPIEQRRSERDRLKAMTDDDRRREMERLHGVKVISR
jgi:hypothetical protein